MLKYDIIVTELKLEDIKELWTSVGWEIYYDGDGFNRLANALNINNNYCKTTSVFHNNKLIAVMHVLTNGLTAYLLYLVVHKDYQHQGIGNELLGIYDDEYKDYFREFMATNEAFEFYKKNGYGHYEEYTAMAKWIGE